jgi:hypothetical protein
VVERGGLVIEPDGDRIIRSLYPAAVLSHSLSNRHTGVLQSRRFLIDSDNIFVRAWGRTVRCGWLLKTIRSEMGDSILLFGSIVMSQAGCGWTQPTVVVRTHGWSFNRRSGACLFRCD